MISEMEQLPWSDQYSSLNHNPWIQTLLAIYVAFTLICGTCLLSGICLFERFGGDPQKRNLQNQVINSFLDHFSYE